ncbi:MAG: hypothetical protein WC227_00570 [Patescibacteria group bacterium]|jgi:hypothetical protein
MKHRSRILQKEQKTLEGFFGKKFVDIPDLPSWVTDELIEHWEENLFFVHYLPDISLEHHLELPAWKDRPAKIFYQKIKEGKLHPKAKSLPGKWILLDGRDKPEQKVFWISALDAKVIKKFVADPRDHIRKWSSQKHGKEYLKDELGKRGFGSRYCLTPSDIHELKPFILKFLKIDPKQKIRLPYFIEFNYLGNAAYPQWRKTKTWEWFEDKMTDNCHLASGSKSVGIIGWDPTDHWSTILGFRVVIEL